MALTAADIAVRYPSRTDGPVTGEVGFAAASPADLADWWGSDMHDWRQVEPRWPDGAAARDALAPQVPLTRYAFVPVTDGWTLMLNNAPRGTDMTVLPSQAARALGCRTVRAFVGQHGDVWPGCMLEVWGPDGDPILRSRRSIAALNDGGRWVFEVSGEPFDFEDQDAYERRRKADRFTPDMLADYLRHLDVPADTEPDWGAALLMQRS